MRKFRFYKDIYKIENIIETLIKFDVLLLNDWSTFADIIDPNYYITSVKKLMKLIKLYYAENKKNTFYAIIVRTEIQQIFVTRCIEEMNLQKKNESFS